MDPKRYSDRFAQINSGEIANIIAPMTPRLLGFDYCLVGGYAVAYYVNPPITVDVDFLVLTDFKPLYERLKALRQEGFYVSVFGTPMRRARPGIFRNGVRVISPPSETPLTFDLLTTGGDAFLQRVVEQAKTVMLPGADQPVKIARIEDIAIMKILAGRDKDVDDVAMLSSTQGFDEAYMFQALAELGW